MAVPPDMMKSFRQKTSLVLFGVLTALVLLEAGMRLAGFAILSWQEYRNMRSIRERGQYRILCLGESTTQGQYPRFLETILNQRNTGIQFSVIDKGRGGTSTGVIIGEVASYLDKYRPDIVVAMMGVNDGRRDIPSERLASSKIPLFISSLRTTKLARLIWLHVTSKVKDPELYQPEKNMSFGEKRKDEKDGLVKTAASIAGDDQAHFELGNTYQKEDRFRQAEEEYKRALALNPENEQVYIELGDLYRKQGQFKKAAACLKRGLAKVHETSTLYGALVTVYEEACETDLARKYYHNTNELRCAWYNPLTASNYLRLKDILDKRKIKLVCVQHPMRAVGD